MVSPCHTEMPDLIATCSVLRQDRVVVDRAGLLPCPVLLCPALPWRILTLLTSALPDHVLPIHHYHASPCRTLLCPAPASPGPNL